ncbi:hypothetical protein [Vibrio vulnificus]|uniref:hypothetical protein n=1 Tax=Vibrio vulnificus TaxID=672 RepID=UPI00102960D9|nr:hypothetical protein [Vibrio vulnificus]RZP95251.1 hypothetical protein D8T54_13775 [Vibrio vulnificus]
MVSIRPLLLCAVTLLSGWHVTSHAAQVEGRITGDKWHWASAHTQSSGVAPSLWDIPVSLPVAERVILGGVLNQSEQTITLRSGGTSVALPLVVKGVQYRLSSFAGMNSVAGGNATISIDGNAAEVTGIGVSGTAIVLRQTETPFTHYRPILAPIDTNAWVQAFSRANAERGRYQGVVPIVAVYDYVRDGVRARQVLNLTLTLIIDYAPEVLSNVNVSPNNIMTATYHYPDLVSGELTYTVTATGYFTDGVSMGLVAPTGKPYFSLTSAEVGNSDEIKYTVRCTSGCTGQDVLIDDGVPKIDNLNNRAQITAVKTKQAVAQLRVSFDRKPLVKNGTYSGSFILMFEARI